MPGGGGILDEGEIEVRREWPGRWECGVVGWERADLVGGRLLGVGSHLLTDLRSEILAAVYRSDMHGEALFKILTRRQTY